MFRRTSLHESSPYLHLDPDDRMPNSYAPAVAEMASMPPARRSSSASYFGPASDVATPSYGYQGGTYDPAPAYHRRQARMLPYSLVSVYLFDVPVFGFGYNMHTTKHLSTHLKLTDVHRISKNRYRMFCLIRPSRFFNL